MSAREVARRVLDRVDKGGAWATLTLDAELARSGLDERDRRLASELVYGVLRHRTRIDRALAAHADLKKPPPKVLTVLRVAAYQILLLDRVPPYAAVDDAVAAARDIAGAKVGGFANAVLRKLASAPVGAREPALPALTDATPLDQRLARLEIEYSMPRWILDELLGSLKVKGETDPAALARRDARLAELAAAFGEQPPVIARVNRRKTTRDALAAELSSRGISASPVTTPGGSAEPDSTAAPADPRHGSTAPESSAAPDNALRGSAEPDSSAAPINALRGSAEPDSSTVLADPRGGSTEPESSAAPDNALRGSAEPNSSAARDNALRGSAEPDSSAAPINALRGSAEPDSSTVLADPRGGSTEPESSAAPDNALRGSAEPDGSAAPDNALRGSAEPDSSAAPDNALRGSAEPDSSAAPDNALRGSAEPDTTRVAMPFTLRLDGLGDPSTDAAFAAGRWTVQDAGAQLVAELAAPRPGMRILDACAGVGGKSTHLAELADDAATIDAADQSATKLGLLRETAHRLGLASIATQTCDLLDPAAPLRDDYDLIVLDAPCSGLGVLRRHPDAKWRLTRETVPRLADLQRQLLDAVVKRLAPGGALVYAVCTFTRAEGPDQIAAFAERAGLKIVEERRTWPPDADAFYIARLVRA